MHSLKHLIEPHHKLIHHEKGPLFGGYLSKPREKFPNAFRAEFWQGYPYFLPCACAAAFPLVAIIGIAALFEEVRIVACATEFQCS